MNARLKYAAGLALALAGLSRAQAPSYNLTDATGALPGGVFGVVGLSDAGFVTAWRYDGVASSGYRWSVHGATLALLDPPAGVAWGDHAGHDVSSAGVVVGAFGTQTGGLSLRRGFRWLDGECEELFTPLGLAALPEAVSDGGWIACVAAQRPGGTPGAVRWSPALVPEFVGDLDALTDVDDRGAAVGYRLDAQDPRTARGFLFDGAALVPLGSLDPAALGDVVPRALDELGRVVGSSTVQGVERAFSWTAAAGMVELAALGGGAPLGDTAALDASDAGLVVGYSASALGRTAVAWAVDGSVHELRPRVPALAPGRPWQLFSALRVNAAGQIAGTAVRGGQTRAVLLTPAAIQAGALVPGGAGTASTLAAAGLVPGRRAFLVGDLDDPLDRAYTRIAGCRSMGLCLARPRFAATAVADPTGAATFAWTPPAALAGAAVRLQVFQFGACTVSNVVQTTL